MLFLTDGCSPRLDERGSRPGECCSEREESSVGLVAATHRLEGATQPSLAGDLDRETAQPGARSSDQRIVKPSCRRQSREGEIEADGRENMTSDPASVSSDRAPVRADRAVEVRTIARRRLSRSTGR